MAQKAKQVPIRDELKILNRDLLAETIVIGSIGYEILPMGEGDLEKIIWDMATVIERISSPDGFCPICEKVFKNALQKKIFNCPDDNEPLLQKNESPIEAILKSSKVPAWVEIVTGIPADETKDNMTYNQMRHFAGIFWKQNFSDEGMPEESLENFQKLLRTLGIGKIPESQKSGKDQPKKTEAPSVPEA